MREQPDGVCLLCLPMRAAACGVVHVVCESWRHAYCSLPALFFIFLPFLSPKASVCLYRMGDRVRPLGHECDAVGSEKIGARAAGNIHFGPVHICNIVADHTINMGAGPHIQFGKDLQIN
jgi:hypothetical protein